jgi:hypothetical protein
VIVVPAHPSPGATVGADGTIAAVVNERAAAALTVVVV